MQYCTCSKRLTSLPANPLDPATPGAPDAPYRTALGIKLTVYTYII